MKKNFTAYQLMCLKGRLEEKCEEEGIDFYKHNGKFVKMIDEMKNKADMDIAMKKGISIIKKIKTGDKKCGFLRRKMKLLERN